MYDEHVLLLLYTDTVWPSNMFDLVWVSIDMHVFADVYCVSFALVKYCVYCMQAHTVQAPMQDVLDVLCVYSAIVFVCIACLSFSNWTVT